jgi:hypothetical protein
MRASAEVKIPKMEKRDRIILKPRQVIYVRCDFELFKKLHKRSKDTGISVNELTMIAIEEYISAKHGK